jgi:glycosyltransferase involved in cell wall biosynthesis
VKVLHLFSDWRWTGPAEPTVNLCRTLSEQGVQVTLACRRPVEGYPQSIRSKAEERGVAVTSRFYLNRYLHPRETLWDLTHLGGVLAEEGYDLIHCHLSHDHFLGGWAARASSACIPIVRTNHKARPLKASLGNRWLLRRWTDGLVEFSERAAEADIRGFGLMRERVLRVEGAVDLERFHPDRASRGVRSALGVAEDEILVGIVARMQRHRRFETLLKAMALLKGRRPAVRLMVLGRGTHMQSVAVEPARRMGLGEMILFPGYRGEDYVEHLGAMDVKVFLVPGSDGTCRAVREAMAMAKPVVASRRGILPELVEDGRTGLLVDEEPSALAEAIHRLAAHKDMREAMGRAGRQKALASFSMARQARQVAGLYVRLVSGKGP